jgi:hypothetical protein
MCSGMHLGRLFGDHFQNCKVGASHFSVSLCVRKLRILEAPDPVRESSMPAWEAAPDSYTEVTSSNLGILHS